MVTHGSIYLFANGTLQRSRNACARELPWYSYIGHTAIMKVSSRGLHDVAAVDMTVPLFKVFMAPEASERVKTVLESGFITQGPVVEALEAEMRSRLKCALI